MPTTKVKNLVKKIKGLTQYRNMTDDELIATAEEMLEKKANKDKDILDIGMFFDNKDEKKSAEKLLTKYMDNYSIETVSDKNTIIQLIFLEILHFRFMKSANESQKENRATPGSLVDTIHKNIKEIRDLKNQLGILKSKSGGDSASAIDILKKKYKKWCEENQASRTLVCPDPNCGQMVLLKIKTDVWEAQEHPFFKDRVLGNKHLIKLYQDGILSAHDVGLILDCSEFYVSWLIKKWNLDKKPEISKTVELVEDKNLEAEPKSTEESNE